MPKCRGGIKIVKAKGIGTSAVIAIIVIIALLGIGGYFALKGGEEGVPAPAEFEVSNLVFSPSEVEIGESVTISATVRNVGDLDGTYTVELKIDGVIQETKEITLAGGASKTVSFTVTKNTPRTYTIGVNGLQRLLNVLERIPKATVTLGDVKFEDLQTWGKTYIKATIRGDEANYSLELDCPTGNRVDSSAGYVTKDEMSDGYHSVWLLMSDVYQAPKGGKYTLTVTDGRGNLVDRDEITFSGPNLVASDFVFTFSEFNASTVRLEDASFTLKNSGDLPAFVGTDIIVTFPETASLASPPQKIEMQFSPWKFALYPGELKRVSEQTNWLIKKGTYTVLIEVYEGMFYFIGDEMIDEGKFAMTTTTTVTAP